MKLFSIFGFCAQANNLQREDEIFTTKISSNSTAGTILRTATEAAETTTVATETTEAIEIGTCKIPEPTLWGNPETDCLGFGEECQIDKNVAEQFQAYQRVPGASETDKPTWDTAVQYCNSLGMDLATVADDDEYAVLREYVKQYDRCMWKGKEVGTTYWYIGLARDHATAPFKWRHSLQSGESKYCPIEQFGAGKAYWAANNPPGSNSGDMERNCVYMISGKDQDESAAYTAARCDYNENNAIQFVCQKPRVENRCGTGDSGGNGGSAESIFISAILALGLAFLH